MREDGVLHFERLPQAVSIRLCGMGWSALQPGRWEWRLAKPYWVFYLNDRDGGSVSVAGEWTPLRAGRRYLIPPRLPYETTCSARLRHLYIYIDIIGAGHIGAAGQSRHLLEVPSAIDLGWLLEVAQQAGRCLGPAEQAGFLSMVLDVIAPELPSGGILPDPDPRLRPALRHIDRRLSGHMTVEQLACLCGLSENAFTSRFRAAFGTTSVDYVRGKRADRAAMLLSSTAWSMERIARACGFGNRTYMARVFRQVIGISPGEYRHASAFERH